MKKVISGILTIVFMLTFSTGVFAFGITGGTAKNTTEKQSDATRGNGGECRAGISDEQALDLIEKLGNSVAPSAGTGVKYFLKTGEAVGEAQRATGGVTTTGSTVR